MKNAIYPGTFDPLTNGHVDIIKRSISMFDKVVLAIAKSESKSPLFSLEQRLEMAQAVTKDMPKVECIVFDELLASLAKHRGINIIIRGLRVVSDFEYELQMGYANNSLNPSLDTIYFMPTLQNAFISSSIVRSIITHGGNANHLLPSEVATYIQQHLKK
ncbi:pantetheine-phosphate adenylyltransferase [Helicobacter sp. 11S02629-2]|uniref:pantetheine-phosphate adenylyltransferase n=1 Tax=Helicobacter sp. 11S02629-2 TaxID=1476195 RepID=UPI000BA62B27|nr:pantetheine-phosphate adenylyltransferase [Helicobacter sp. 11S02629-2]PAF45694.1 pantetheine-phosphate adenylyltransferase [Helicobacter sp. 11S02629-2]